MLAQLSKKQSELILVTPAAKMASQTREKRFNITNNNETTLIGHGSL